MTCGEVEVRYVFSCAIVDGYTGVAVPPPVVPDANPGGVPLTRGEMARLSLMADAPSVGTAIEQCVRSANMAKVTAWKYFILRMVMR